MLRRKDFSLSFIPKMFNHRCLSVAAIAAIAAIERPMEQAVCLVGEIFGSAVLQYCLWRQSLPLVHVLQKVGLVTLQHYHSVQGSTVLTRRVGLCKNWQDLEGKTSAFSKDVMPGERWLASAS